MKKDGDFVNLRKWRVGFFNREALILFGLLTGGDYDNKVIVYQMYFYSNDTDAPRTTRKDFTAAARRLRSLWQLKTLAIDCVPPQEVFQSQT